MLFSSTLFLFLFLPIVLGVYTLLPKLLKNAWLLLASLLFYAWGEPKLVWVMLLSIAGNYGFGLWIAQVRAKPSGKLVLGLAVASNLALLATFKYAAFATENLDLLLRALGMEELPIPAIVMPLGISFFTFHAMSYVIDVYRGDAKVQRNLLDLALYVTLFPQLIAGPILRYHDVAWQLVQRQTSRAGFAYGIQRFILGLGKKVLIANTLALPCDRIFALPADELSAPTAWLGILTYTGQIYFDFSGYSDMAIGLGHLFGFQFPENFQWPYASRSVREFWRRWHISLSTWFRDYLYIPLGGNRGSELRTAGNLMLVFILCGFWHGAAWTFLAWGLYHGAFLALERTRWARWLELLPRPLQHGYAVLVAMGGWVLFRASDLPHALDYFAALAGQGGKPEAWPVGQYLTRDVMLGLVAGTIGAAPTFDWALDRSRRVLSSLPLPITLLARGFGPIAAIAALLTIFVACSVMLAAQTHNPFIYFRF